MFCTRHATRTANFSPSTGVQRSPVATVLASNSRGPRDARGPSTRPGAVDGVTPPACARPLMRVRAPHRAPRLPGDPQDHGGHGEADQRVGDGYADRDGASACDDRERYVGVSARVRAIGDQRRTVEPSPRAAANAGRESVSGEADDARGRENQQV